MEDKTFELLSKMHGEFSEFKRDSTERLMKVENVVTRIENDHGNKLEALFDGYKQVYEKQMEHDYKFDSIESGLDKQEVEIKVFKGGKVL